jgi:hypothetical protein
MAMTPAVGLGALALALVAALSACQGSSTPTGDPSTSATSEPTSPSPDPTSPSPTSTSPTDEASAEAVALVPTYLKMLDDLAVDPTLPLSRLHNVTVSPEFTIQVAGIAKFRAKGYRQVGHVQLVKTSVRRVSLANRPTASPSPQWPTVRVTACVDVSAVKANNKAGESVIPKNRPKYLIEQLTITNRQYPDQTGWRVSHAPNTQAASCNG